MPDHRPYSDEFVPNPELSHSVEYIKNNLRVQHTPDPYPYTLLTNTGANSYDLDKEDMRIILCALAGFELTREERQHIRGFYYHVFNELAPGALKPGVLEEVCRKR